MTVMWKIHFYPYLPLNIPLFTPFQRYLPSGVNQINKKNHLYEYNWLLELKYYEIQRDGDVMSHGVKHVRERVTLVPEVPLYYDIQRGKSVNSYIIMINCNVLNIIQCCITIYNFMVKLKLTENLKTLNYPFLPQSLKFTPRRG